MRKLVIFVVLFAALRMPVSAVDIQAPEVPDAGRVLMPSNQETFGDGLLEIFRDAAAYFLPDLREASSVCLSVLAAVMAISFLQSLPGSTARAADLAGVVMIAAMLLGTANSLINLGSRTVAQISDYGKLLLPVMTGAMAAQGGITTASALYAGTALFDSILTTLIVKLLTPMLYLYLALAAANGAIGEMILKKLRDGVRWAMTWALKIILYVFTGYMGVTGVVSGTTDAAALKAAKLTISGAVPVVGSILSDASEAVLVTVGTMKNAAGIYGLLALMAICLGPFLRIAAHYLMLKLTAGICGVFGSQRMSELIQDFSSAMGFLLGMTGAVCLMMLISTFCFLKGVA